MKTNPRIPLHLIIASVFLVGCFSLIGVVPGLAGPRSELAGTLAAAPDPGGLAEAMEKARHSARPAGRSAGEYLAGNPGHGFSARFSGEGLALTLRRADGQPLESRWRTAALGYGDVVTPVPIGEVSSEGNRVEIRRAAVVEWFVNRPEGLEHGWTLPAAPAANPGGESLVVELALEGDLHVEVSEGGQEVILRDAGGREMLRYEKLKVWDATGRILDSRMTGGGDRLAVLVEESGARYPLTIDPVFVQEAGLNASNAGQGDSPASYGAVDIDGNTVVIGAPGEDGSGNEVNPADDNLAPDAGAAYVFVYDVTTATWVEQAYLKASDSAAGDAFGRGVAIDGDTIVVGAPLVGNQRGAAYVYVRTGSSWSFQQKIDAYAAQNRAASVAIDGDTLVYGCPGGGDGNRALVYTRSGSTWSLQATLVPFNAESGDGFGNVVVLEGDLVAVSSPSEDGGATGVNGSDNNDVSGAGAVYIFERTGGSWSQVAYVKSSNPSVSDNFGGGENHHGALGLSQGTLVVSARQEDGSIGGVNPPNDDAMTNSGAVYVYVKENGIWKQQALLKAAAPYAGALLGRSVDIDGDNLLATSGSTSIRFLRAGGVWSQAQILNNGTTTAAVAVSGELAVTGSRIHRLLDDPIGKLSALKPFKKTQLKKKSKSQILTISNLGEAPLTGSKLGLTGKAAKDFKLIGVPAASIDGGASSSVKILFKPRKVGSRKATVNLTSNAALVSTLAKGKALATASKK